jgi:hypothetical protein
MFADRFSPLINAFPQEADAIRRVAEHFGSIELRDGIRVLDVEMNPGRLFDVSQAGSSARFAKVTTILIQAGILERKYVIRSPLGPAIMEVDSWYDCPLSVYDPLRDVTMEVSDNDLETMYSVVKDGLH